MTPIQRTRLQVVERTLEGLERELEWSQADANDLRNALYFVRGVLRRERNPEPEVVGNVPEPPG